MSKRIFALFLATVFVCGVLPFAVFAEESDENLVLFREYAMETGEPISKTYGDLTVNGVAINKDEGRLTDGETAENNKDDARWFPSYSGQSRIITFDLEQACRISYIECGFLDDRNNDIQAPRYIKIYLSADGEKYEQVKEYLGEYINHPDGRSVRYGLRLTLDRVYAARFVRVEYSCYEYTYCDEIRVLGSKTLSGAERNPRGTADEINGGYTGDASGRRDIVKLYNGYWPKDTSVGVLTAAELLPYVAYVNKNDEIAGRMFDGAVILPCDVTYPSGGGLYGADGRYSTMSDYQLYIDHTFTAGQDISALNKVVGDVNKALGSTEKFGVFLAIPYPCISDVPFGDIDGDGVYEYSKNLQDRLDIVKWYVDECTYAFGIGGYNSLELCGFYWLNDSVDYGYSDHETQLITAVNDYIVKQRLETLCSFGYLSSGFDSQQSLGFDSAVMKAEMIEKGFSAEMLPEYSRSVYNNRLGVEIETGCAEDYLADESEYLTLGRYYESYMYYGKKYGYSAGLNLYEQSMAPGSIYEFCYADKSTPKGAYLRRLYELTYSYINNNYNNLPPTVSLETQVEIMYGDDQITLDLQIKDVDSYSEDLTVEFSEKPAHGRVVASAGKNKLIYSVDKDFEGTDSFTVSVSDGFNYCEPVVVTVSVVKPQSDDEKVDYNVSAEPLPLGGRMEMPPWLMVLLIGLALAMLAVAITVALKPKSNK